MTIEVLKEATAEHHERAERSPAMTLLMSERLTLRAYGDILLATYGFVRALEASLLSEAPEITARFSYWQRVKTPFLARDLALIDRDLPASPVNVVSNHWSFERPERALGAMYVMEGATLGGKYVSEHVSRVLGFEPPAGVSYFHSYGKSRGRMWNAFKREANQVIAQEGWEHGVMVDAAKETFDRYSEAMHGE
jgi:heme oxygenase (biliverdin-IX-beta and delta-forming)